LTTSESATATIGDSTFTFTRDEILQAYDQLRSSLPRIISDAKRDFQIDEVELFGGCSRVPILLKTIKEMFNVPVSNSHPEDALAIGGSFRHFAIDNSAQLFSVDLTDGHFRLPLCRIGSPCVTEISVPGNQTVYHVDFIDGPIASNLATWRQVVYLSPNVTKLHFAHNPLTVIAVDVCDPVCFPGNFTYRKPPVVADRTVELIIKPEAKIGRSNAVRKELEQALARIPVELGKNETVREFSNESQRQEVLECLEPEQRWFKSTGFDQAQTFGTLSKHLGAVINCVAPVYRRITENASSWEIIQQFQEEALSVAELLPQWKTRAPVCKLAELEQFESGFGKTLAFVEVSRRENAAAPRDDWLPFRPLLLKERYQRFHLAAMSLRTALTPAESKDERHMDL
jgi:hypothetical protein